MIDKEISAVNQLGKILTAIHANSDQELVLISDLGKQIDFIAGKLGSVTASLNHVNANLTDIDDNIKTATTNNNHRPNVGGSSNSQQTTPQNVTNISDTQTTTITNNTSTINHSVVTPPAKVDRKNELTATAAPREKPTFTHGAQGAQDVDNTQSVDRVVDATEAAVKVAQQSIKQSEETSNLLADYWRDEKGRLRHKSGRYASKDESKAYETAEREKQKKEAKGQGIIARFIGALNQPKKVDGAEDAKEVAGAAAGGSLFYAAREMYGLANDVKGVFTNDKPSTAIDDENKPADTNNSSDNSNGNTTVGTKKGDPAREKSNRKQELRNQAEQTETLKEQTVEQAKHYDESTTLLEEIAKNTKPKGESLLKSIGSLGSLLGGGINRIRGKGKGGVSIDVPATSNDNDQAKKTKGKGKGKGKGKSKKVDIAQETKPTKTIKSVLDNGVENTPKAKGSLLSKAGGVGKGLAKKIPLIGAIATAGDSLLSLKDRDDLNVSQKAVKTVATTGGTVAGGYGGAIAGGMAGAAVGSVVPVVGTAIGGAIGSIVGAIGGSWLGEKTGDAVGGKISNAMSKDTSISDTLSNAWDDTLKDSESTIKTVFSDVFGGLFGKYKIGDFTPNDYSKTDYKKGDAIDQRIDKFAPVIDRESKKHGLRPELIKSVIRQESGGITDAKSHVGASGLMQLMPATAKELGVNDSTNPEQNIEGGAKYLAQHVKKYSKKGYSEDDATKLALASYNAGSGWVDAAINKSGGSMDGEAVLASLRDPSLQLRGKTRSTNSINETDGYVKKIYSNYDAMRKGNGVVASTQGVSTPHSAQGVESTQTVQPTAITPAVESVNDIDTRNMNTPKPPEKVIIANQPKPQPAIKTVKASGGNESKTTNNNTTINSSNLVASNTVIPTDFDDVSLRLQGWDRN